MAWDEWEQLKTAAANGPGTHMELNHVPSDPGVSGTLLSNKPAWSKAGQAVGSLSGSITAALERLTDGQKGLVAETGCQTSGAQKEVHDSWDRYVKAVSGRCTRLSDLLEKAGTDLLKTDESVKAEIGNLKVDYADTPTVGGQGKGR
ncbi:hypothetical protein ACIHEJ_15530 [Streptomyces sp. NPDC052301]|uniref:hypothetical protein n=1 Tax=Streptomyces sp. NPDC052301 TaxID=3365687 RepID=UPI0037D46EDC